MIDNTKNAKLDPTKIDYEKRSRMKKNQRDRQRRMFMKLKNPEEFRVRDAKSVQETIEIMKMSPDGFLRFQISYIVLLFFLVILIMLLKRMKNR